MGNGDAYLQLLRSGEATKEEIVSVARETGSFPPARGDKNAETPQALAARAAGLDDNTYTRFRYVDDDKGEKDIDDALAKSEIAPQQASALDRSTERPTMSGGPARPTTLSERR